MAFGSLVNSLMGSSEAVPAVGMGATELCWSDRHAYTIVKVSPSGKTIWVRQCIAKRVDKNGMSESQAYEFSEDPEGELLVVRRTKKGWSASGRKFVIGFRQEYHDYSF